MKFGVVIFPGSNCDHDMLHVIGNVCKKQVVSIWHKDTDLQNVDCIILPGGFSYGDYLRSGALASHSPIMKSVKKFASEGGFVFGVCNGFQILCESGLLPGALLRNQNQLFICDNTYIKATTNNTRLTQYINPDSALKIPIAHGEGRYYADEATLQQLVKNDQIIFQYSDKNGVVNEQSNPNGSLMNIAGICNATRNVFGMMPHPERCAEQDLGNTDGLQLFHSLIGEEQFVV